MLQALSSISHSGEQERVLPSMALDAASVPGAGGVTSGHCMFKKAGASQLLDGNFSISNPDCCI